MRYDISVIIPTYNNSKTIKRCVESIKNNGINTQIIIINDGSIDNTINILNEFDDVELINLDYNHGVSFSRNIGINKIKGEYFTFLDADDYLEENTYEILLKNARENNLDICGCNYFQISKNKIKSKYCYDEKILNNSNLMKVVFTDKISLVVWDKIYRTKKYKHLFFNENLKINEDYDYSIRCFNITDRAMFLNLYLYNYFKNNESLTNNYTCLQIKENDYIKYLEKNVKDYPEYYFFKCMNNLKKLHLYSKCIDIENRYIYIKENINRNELKELLKYDLSITTKIEIFIFLRNIKFHLFLYPIYQLVKNIVRR